MAIYLGNSGGVELKRDSITNWLETQLDPADVNVSRKRFSVDFSSGSLITGDQIEIATVDGTNLELVSGHNYPDGRWYAHIDEAGGIRLYSTFDTAVTGGITNALTLVEPSTSKNIQIRTRNSQFRSVARVRSYEITTERETVDLTQCGDEFRRQYEAGLISGQGSLECIWEHSAGGGRTGSATTNLEFPAYLARLVIRIQQGADFIGRFFIYEGSAQEDSVWYEADCVVTNVAVTVPATDLIETNIQFVTNGPFALKQGKPPSYLLQEDGALLLQEDGSSIALEYGG
jgi:hypothetical protein